MLNIKIKQKQQQQQKLLWNKKIMTRQIWNCFFVKTIPDKVKLYLFLNFMSKRKFVRIKQEQQIKI